MRYCLPYRPESKLFKEPEEYTLEYEKYNSDLIEFMDQHKDKTIILSVHDGVSKDDFDKLILLGRICKNMKLAFSYNSFISRGKFDLNIPFFFLDPVGDYETLNLFLSYKVSDIYIVGQLGFELDSISKLCKEMGVAIRVFPNIATSTTARCPKLQQFFIRPEDTYIYENYVDVFEFVGEPSKVQTFYKIYAKDFMWLGDLAMLVNGLDTKLEGSAILSAFGESRVGCKRKCLSGKSCRICYHAQELSATLAENGYVNKMIEIKEK